MKKLSIALLFFVLACVGHEVFDYFSSLSEAIGAYQDQATMIATARRHEYPFKSIDGYIVDVNYVLVSADLEGKDKVRLVAEQSVHFQKGLQVWNVGGRKIAKTRHKALMTRANGHWRISELTETTTEVTRLEDSLSTE